MKNPWLTIPAKDYENHMSQIGQTKLINDTFKFYYRRFKPESVLILGATTGNGFEYIKPFTTKITAIDINKKYLEILKERFSRVKGLEIINALVEKVSFPKESYDFIFGALIFEYIPVAKVMSKLESGLKRNGRLIFILQLKDRKLPPISKTNYSSLLSLKKVMKLVNTRDFARIARDSGFTLEEATVKTKNGKRFQIGVLKKSHS